MATTARVRVSTAARASPASAGARASRRRAVAAARGRGGRRLARASTASSSSETTTDATYVESEEEEAERVAVGALVGWCVERGATGSGLSVLLPDGSGRGRGLEASRDIEVRVPTSIRPSVRRRSRSRRARGFRVVARVATRTRRDATALAVSSASIRSLVDVGPRPTVLPPRPRRLAHPSSVVRPSRRVASQASEPVLCLPLEMGICDDQARSISHWSPYDRVRVVNAVP